MTPLPLCFTGGLDVTATSYAAICPASMQAIATGFSTLKSTHSLSRDRRNAKLHGVRALFAVDSLPTYGLCWTDLKKPHKGLMWEQ